LEKILNLTIKNITPLQYSLGVIEPMNKDQVIVLLTFNELPKKDDMILRALKLADICLYHQVTKAMIGGVDFFMCTLEHVLMENGIKPVYSFSNNDHLGWV